MKLEDLRSAIWVQETVAEKYNVIIADDDDVQQMYACREILGEDTEDSTVVFSNSSGDRTIPFMEVVELRKNAQIWGNY